MCQLPINPPASSSSTFAALIFLAAVVLTVFPVSLQSVKVWMHKDATILVNQLVDPSLSSPYIEHMEAVSCNKVNVTPVWTQSFPKLASESPLRKADLNGDGVEDIIFGYGIDSDQASDGGPEKTVCYSSKTGESVRCEGGILALNGATGATIWQRWTAFNVFSIFCNVDLNGDQRNDCVASGRGGLIIAVNGETGNLMWTLKESPEDIPENELIIDLYTINPIRDLDGDNVIDIMAVHVEENEATRTGHIRLISGATGKVIKSLPTPFNEEVFVPLQMITNSDGTEQLLILTGGQNTPGGVYLTNLLNIMKKQDKTTDYRTVFRNKDSGFMAPAILTDVNLDGVPDMILSSFNSTVYAFDGRTYAPLWNFSFPSSESVTSIVPGHFDRDNITDLMVKYSTGPGFPIYYYSQTIVLNGVNGTSLLDNPILDSGGANNLLGGLSISPKIPAVGDYFLHWQTECNNKEKPTDAYQFIPESSIVEQSRADTCMLRYNERTVLKLYGLTRHLQPPGFLLFTSDEMELNYTGPSQGVAMQGLGNTNSVKKTMVVKHPKMQKKVTTTTNEEVQGGNYGDPRAPMGNDIKRIDLDEKPQRSSSKARTHPGKHQGHIYANSNPFGETRGQPQQQQQQQQMKNLMMNKNRPYPYNFGQGFQGFSENSPNSRKPQNGYNNNNNNFENQASPDYGENLNSYYQDEVLPMLSNYALASQYPTNRDVRSKSEDNALTLEDMLNVSEDQNGTDSVHSEVHDDTQTVKKVLNDEVIKPYIKGHSETLWDIEMEKEAAEAMKDDYPYRNRRDVLKAMTMSAVASTGVLLKPLMGGGKAIDYVFALNVRESEPFPPLLLPEDLACVEEKVKTFQSE